MSCQLLNFVFSIFNTVFDSISAHKLLIYEKTDTHEN